MITLSNFRGMLNDLGYYSGDEFEASEQVREYLTVANLTDCLGEHGMEQHELDRLAALAVDHREHFAQATTRFQAGDRVCTVGLIPEDSDAGIVRCIEGNTVEIGWDTGVITDCDINDPHLELEE